MAIALRKAGIARKKKRNPVKSWTKSPVVWIGGGAVLAFFGYRWWKSTPAVAPSAPTAALTPAQNQALVTSYQTALSALQAANPFPSPDVLQQITSLRAAIVAAGGTPS